MKSIIGFANFVYFFTHFPSAVAINSNLNNQISSVKITNSNQASSKDSDGRETEMDVPRCVASIPSDSHTNSDYTSYTVLTGCIIFYSGRNCTGEFEIKQSGWAMTGRNNIHSIGPCEDKCPPNDKKAQPTNFTSKVTLTSYTVGITLLTLDVQGCVLIPILNRDVQRASFNGSTCIEFHEHWNCTGRTSGPYEVSIDFKTSTFAKSVSPCGYNCGIRPETERQVIGYPGPGFVTLFDEKDFNGNYRHIKIGQGCQEVFYGFNWEGKWRSIRTYGQCITVHTEPSCSDLKVQTPTESWLLLNDSNPGVHADFGLTLKSVKQCHQTASTVLYVIVSRELVDVSNCVSSSRFEEPTAFIQYTSAYNGCVKIYKGKGCKGKYIVKRPGGSYGIRFFWSQEDRDIWKRGAPGSIGPCQCRTGTEESRVRDTLVYTTTLYSLENQTGQNVTLKVTGCQTVPRKMQCQVQSVRSNYDGCIELHEHWDCTGRSFEFEANKQREVIHKDLAVPVVNNWSWKNPISSVSPCKSACDVQQLVKPRNITFPGPNFVSVFDEFGFKGNVEHLDLQNGCFTIEEEFPEWNGEIKSVSTYKQCVVMYDTKKCTIFRGSKYLQLNESKIQDHSSLSFRIRSIKQCRHELEEPLVINIEDKSVLLDGCTDGKLADNDQIDPKGNCVHLYEGKTCTGRYYALTTGAKASGFIWNKGSSYGQAGSISPCECDPRSKEVRYKINASTRITLYDSYHQQGRNVSINVKGCQPIPRILDRTVRSILFNGSAEDECVEFHEHWNCKGRSVQRGRGSRQPQVLINDIAIPDLKSVLDWENLVGSISNCGDCMKNTYTESHYIFTGSKAVILFDERNFEGNFLSMNLSSGCVNVGKEWEDAFKSVKLFTECVIFHSSLECLNSSESSKLHSTNSRDQSDYPRTWPVKSIKLCKETELKQLQSTESSSTLLVIILSISAILVVILATVGSIIIIRLKRRVREFLSEKEIEEFLNGNDIPGIKDTDALGQNQAYDQRYEIHKELLHLDLDSPLGSGAFAVVYKGRMQRSQESEQLVVAVKTVKPYSGVEYTRALLKEIKTMIYVGDQDRIVRIIGCCTENLRTGVLYVMTELCENGSIENFLRNNREGFEDLIENPCMDSNELQMKVIVNYEEMEPISSSRYNTIHLMKWSLQIAEGMEYLTTKKVVHGDLATRNVLLDANFDAKISDFGLSRQLYQYSQYVKKTKSPLPWRWLAIETLTSLTFSTESDVWAFGVTVWEIFSLGGIPFPQKSWNEEFVTDLTNGLRLAKPKYATTEWFAIMIECWRERPSDRIQFPKLRKQFAEILNKCLPSNDDMYLDLTVGYHEKGNPRFNLDQ